MGKCPDREELAAWCLGRVGDSKTGEITDHLGACPACVATLEAIQPSDQPIPPRTDRRREAQDAEPSGEDLTAELPPSRVGPEDRNRIGPYEILSRIGGGGMGTVYRARHTLLGREVAIKVLSPGRLADASAVSRFYREMRSVGSLKHPNVVEANDAGESEGTHYLVMELVKGQDLDALVKRQGPLSSADSCEIIRQACLGLEHAHRRGMVHRDIKPSNVILTSEGRVKLLDFGLARLMTNDPEDDLTASGQMMGTPSYMAPEQASDAHSVDIRADLYSLGCTLYFLLAGKPPFDGPLYRTPFERMMAHSRDRAPEIREVRPDVSAGVGLALEKLLSKSPGDRFATPADLAAALEPSCQGQRLATLLDGPAPPSNEAQAAIGPPVNPDPTTKIGSRREPRRRRPRVVTAVLAAMIPAALFLAYQVVIIRDKDGKVVVTARIPDGGSVEVGPGIVPPALPGAVGPAMSPIALVRSPARLPGVESWTIETRLVRGGAMDAAFDSGGRWLAISGKDGSVRVYDASTGGLARVLVGEGEYPALNHPVAWQPGTEVLASGGDDRTIRLWDAHSGRLVRVFQAKAGIGDLAWAPDGKTLVSATNPGDMTRLWDFDSGRCVEEVNPSVGRVAWSPDGRKLAIFTRCCDQATNALTIRDVAAHETSLEIVDSEQFDTPAFSPDGSILATSFARTSRVIFRDSRDGRRIRTLEGCTAISSLAWSPDGSKIATGNNMNVKIWEVGSGHLLATLPSGWGTVVRSLSWSPDGKTLAGVDQYQGTKIWDVASGRSIRVYPFVPLISGSDVGWSNLAWSHDGILIACRTGLGIEIWNAETGTPIRTAKYKRSLVGFSPDGRRIALASKSAIIVEDVASGRPEFTITETDKELSEILSVDWAPDGKSFVVGSEQDLRVVDVEVAAVVRTLPTRNAARVALVWSPDGKVMAVGDRGEIQLRDAGSGEVLRSIPTGENRVYALAWSPDGKTIASGTGDYAVIAVLRLWEVATGKVIRKREVPRTYIETIRWSPDGKTIAVAGDREVTTYDAETGKVLKDHPNTGRYLSPDGRRVADLGAATIHFYDLAGGRSSGSILKLAEPMALAIGPDGHYRGSPGIEAEIVYVVQTVSGQEMLTPEEFARRYGWKNHPGRVSFVP